ncbi:MAG TPA: adenylate/guanylate cyclase domain-containing protein [Allosphingosinicella sp.]|nr:adenylate/guanylate cyclase domain-containing protein [Allosphingosinicella sp.]
MAEEGAERRLRRALRQIGWARLAGTAVFLVIALLLARYSWQVPLASDAERALYDIRFARAATRVVQDDRIVLITYDDQTLRALQKRSPLDRRVLAEALAALDGMKPRAIGIDILFDQPQAEDPQLLATLRGMRTPTLLAYADPAGNEDQIGYEQHEFLRAFIGQARTGRVGPASIRLEPDVEDGVVRRWPERRGNLPPQLANAMSSAHPEFGRYSGSVDFLLPAEAERPVFASFAIDTLPLLGDALRGRIEGRYVLIGGNIKDQDDYETPMSRRTGRWTKGVEVHAHMLAQQLDGRLRPPVPPLALWAIAAAVVLAGGLASLLEARGWRLALVLAVPLLLLAALPFALQQWGMDTYGLPAFGWHLGWAFAFAAVGTAAHAVGSEQRRFAQATLGKYLPADVAAEILKDPERLSLRGEKRQIYALFSDLEGFTRLSHAISPEQLSSLLNRYLDVLSEVVLRHGGTIDKFVGDAVVAFWGAPIAREDDADRAVRAAIAMYEAGEEFRRSAGPGMPPIGCTRVGLHRGEAVVGNFGGEGRIQYTALGDAMNTASRLESANKLLHSTILVSAEAKRETGLDLFRPLGRIVLSGRATPVEVWEPVPHLSGEERQRLNGLWLAFEAGDREALAELRAIAAEGKDAALADFVYRLGQAGPGGHFVLGSK